ncbi:hypothetical protein Taro_041891 [Colocasia esculenta]|uniref:Uncharacterized protein n=1 Tax=Colocasia esculenta TaxID=4460 RepID=A0A843WUX7_COLES|nr:hypothetical protein [Colocasia esculenta]
MVRGVRSGSMSGRSLRGRVLFQASASGSPSVPPPVAAGSGEFTPPQPRVLVAGPSSVSPLIAAGSGQSTPSLNTVVGSVPEDAVSLQEGGGDSFYESTLPEVWINGFNDFPMEVQELLYQMFMQSSIHASFGRGAVSISMDDDCPIKF